MPLSKGKSKAAFVHNIKAEIAAGKPQKQAVAIAYSEKRKHMSGGGFVGGLHGYIDEGKRKGAKSKYESVKSDYNMAEGGEVEEQEDQDLMDHVADEFFRAVDTKDKGLLKDALRALVLYCQDEKSEEGEME